MTLSSPQKTFSRISLDSYEVGHQNWNKDFARSFTNAMGYDLRKFLPVITGRVVQSADWVKNNSERPRPERKAFYAWRWPHLTADKKLIPSSLLGPMHLLETTDVSRR